MSELNALELLREISDEQIQYIVDSLNSNHKITDAEEPFKTKYVILKNWTPECTEYLISKGYKGEHLAVKSDWLDEGDPTTYALFNSDELRIQDLKPF